LAEDLLHANSEHLRSVLRPRIASDMFRRVQVSHTGDGLEHFRIAVGDDSLILLRHSKQSTVREELETIAHSSQNFLGLLKVLQVLSLFFGSKSSCTSRRTIGIEYLKHV